MIMLVQKGGLLPDKRIRIGLCGNTDLSGEKALRKTNL